MRPVSVKLLDRRQALRTEIATRDVGVFIVHDIYINVKYAYQFPLDNETIELTSFVNGMRPPSIAFTLQMRRTIKVLAELKKDVCVCSLFENWYPGEPYFIDPYDIKKFKHVLCSYLPGEQKPDPDSVPARQFYAHIIDVCMTDKKLAATMRHVISVRGHFMLERRLGKCRHCLSYIESL